MDLLVASPYEGESVPTSGETSVYLVVQPGASVGPICVAAVDETHDAEAARGAVTHGMMNRNFGDDDGDGGCSSSGGSLQGAELVEDGNREDQSLYIAGEPILGIVEEDAVESDGSLEPGLEQVAQGQEVLFGAALQMEASGEEGREDELVAEGRPSSEEEDVLQLEGIADHDQVVLLPTAVQEVDDCSDDGPPALPHLALPVPVAGFGEDVSSSLSDDDAENGGMYEDQEYGDEDEDEVEDGGEVEDEDEDQQKIMDTDESCANAGGSRQAASDRSVEALGRAWFDKFERLKTFKARYGHAHVRQDEPLGAWVCVQRQKKKQGKLVAEREQMLKTLGFCFNGKQALDLRNKGDMTGRAAQQPDSPLSCETTPRKHASAAHDLSSRTRVLRDTNILPWRVKREQERESKIHKGKKPKMPASSRHHARHRDAGTSLPSSRHAPARRMPRESTEHRGKELEQGTSADDDDSPDHLRKMAAARLLEAQARWDRRYDELVAFRRKKGYNFETMNCSDKMAFGCELYWWTQNQRQVYRNDSIAHNRLSKLEKIDFNWGFEKCPVVLPVGGERRGPGRPKKDGKAVACKSAQTRDADRADRSGRRSEVWRESDCEKANDLASMFMEGLVMQSLSGPLSKKRGREAWLADLRNALRYDRKGMWHTHERRVCQLLRSLETNLPWRTMNHVFRDQRAPLLSSIKEMKNAANVVLFLQKLTAFTKIEFWRDGYRAYRLDIDEKIRPGGGWKNSENAAEAGGCGSKRKVPVAADSERSSVGSCPPSPSVSTSAKCTLISGFGPVPSTTAPCKRPRLAAVLGAHQSMPAWLKHTVGLEADVVDSVLACLAEEEWGVRTLKMLCALSDVELEEMLAPLDVSPHHAQTVKSILCSIHALRPSFFAHVSALLSKAPESPVAYFISTPPAASVAASASRSSRDKASPVTSTTPRGLALRAAGVSKAHAVLGSNDLSDSCCGARSKHTRAHIGGQRGAGGAGNRRVGELRGKKMHADGTIWYLAHWEEGDTDDDTWEQAAGLGSDEWLVSEWEAEQTALRKPAISVRA